MRSLGKAIEITLRRLRDRLYRAAGATRFVRRSALLSLRDRHDVLGARMTERGPILFDACDRVMGKALIRDGRWQDVETTNAIGLARANRPDWDKRPRTFLDIGANIGTQSVYALWSGAFKRVIAVEPVEANLRLLRANLALNRGEGQQVEVLPVAASDRDGRTELLLHAWTTGGHRVRGPGDNPALVARSKTQTVETVAIGPHLGERGIEADEIGLIWTDCEGHEAAVVAGLGALVEAATPLVIEFSPRWYGADELASLRARLGACYDRFFEIGVHSPIEHDMAAFAAFERPRDLLFL